MISSFNSLFIVTLYSDNRGFIHERKKLHDSRRGTSIQNENRGCDFHSKKMIELCENY